MKLFRIIRLSFYAIFALSISVGYFVYINAISQPLENRGHTLVIPNGVGMSWLANHLEKQGIVENRYVFRIYAWMNKRDVKIKAGEYTLVDIDNIPDLVAKVVPEGLRYSDFITLLSQHPAMQGKPVPEASEWLASMHSRWQHPEGLLFPSTYRFARHNVPTDIIQQAHLKQLQVLQSAWADRADDLPYKTPYEALIMASIIEKETGLASERATIAGVFVRRLQKGMKLQTDPTVIYGMGVAFKGNIRRSDLSRDTPYNTYALWLAADTDRNAG